MSWQRINLSTIEPDILKLIAAAHDSKRRPTAAALRETALALLVRARTLPVLAVPDDAIPTQTGWVGTRYDAPERTEISFWNQGRNALFQAEWDGADLNSLLVQIDERMWMSDPRHKQGWSYDPRGALEVVDNVLELAEIRTAAHEVITGWEREHHPKSGWRCANCSWQNSASENTCVLCLTPQQPSRAAPLTQSDSRADVPPPPFNRPPPENAKPGEAVELALPQPVHDTVRDLADQAVEEGVDTLAGKARDSLLDIPDARPELPRCWRCRSELKRQSRLCPRCGADQHAALKGNRPERPTTLPE